MKISDEILGILNTISDIKTIIYDSGFSSNVRIDRKEDPVAILYLITDWVLDIKNGVSKEQCNIQLFIGKRAAFDSKGEEKDIIVEDTIEIAREFISKLLASNELKVLDDNISLKSTWGKFDSFLVGTSITIRVEEKQGNCIYTEPEPEPEPEPTPEITPEPDEDNNNQENSSTLDTSIFV